MNRERQFLEKIQKHQGIMQVICLSIHHSNCKKTRLLYNFLSSNGPETLLTAILGISAYHVYHTQLFLMCREVKQTCITFCIKRNTGITKMFIKRYLRISPSQIIFCEPIGTVPQLINYSIERPQNDYFIFYFMPHHETCRISVL